MLPVVTNTSSFAVVAHRGGTNFSPVPDSLTTVGGKSHIVIPTNTWSILRSTAPSAPIKLSTNITLARDVGVTCGSANQGVNARLFCKVDSSPMQWDKRRLEYCTRVRIGFEATDGPSERLPAVAVHLQTHNLSLEDETNRVFTLHEPGINASVPVSIFTDKFETDASILASTDVGEQNFLIEIEKLGLWGMITQLCPGPTLFLVMVGSAGGGFLQFRRTRKSGKRAKAWYWILIEGLVAGPIILALVVGLGVNLPIGRVGASTLASPWAWLAISAIGGYGGARLFESMAIKPPRPA
jgi:hypothetical protein